MASPRRKSTTSRKPRAGANQSAAEAHPIKIGEAARQLGVEAYVLRFWESQFPFLRPRQAASSHRLYQPKDLEAFRMIKRLLHVEGFTIAGAKRHIRKHGLARLSANGNPPPEEPAASAGTSAGPISRPDWPRTREILLQIRNDLESVRNLLKQN